ncbi:hypothetical protein QN360_15955, partial [Glaciimonas sp. CA11.2]|uniref:hypothetical protein n=1 Tax=Glaciimonas sp. CA11.2 TaxID=3048601 RepID=UPI002B23CC7B
HSGLVHKLSVAVDVGKKYKNIFFVNRGLCKSLIFKVIFSALSLGNSSSPAYILRLRLSSGCYPQSYPQNLWIVLKALMKPAVSFFPQDSH